MVFSSLLFLFRFLPIVILGYFLLPRKYKNAFLLLASLVFYAWGEPTFIGLMIFSVFVNWISGLLIHKYRSRGNLRAAKTALILSVATNLILLGFFKYTGFILENVNSLFSTDLVLSVVLPIGISFYTFQEMSYVIDVYRGVTQVQKSVISFGCYVSLFPQLIAGPIVQYKTVAEELDNRRESVDLFAEGVRRFVLGLSKKVLLANTLGELWETVSSKDLTSLPVLTAWLGILAFTFQIYFDFSGYSDMAIGLGKMFGFNFLENFNYPYISQSITEFWRRWHISLGTWFREYVYIPLGGNRCGFLKQIRNIIAVWLLTGIWHGASWNFVMWGAYFGIILIAEKLFLLKILQKIPRFFRHLYSALLFVYGWVIFALDKSLSDIFNYTGSLFSGTLFDTESLYLLKNFALLLSIAIIASTPVFKKLFLGLKEKTPRLHAALTVALTLTGLALSVVFTTASSYNPFLYFRF